LRPLEQEEELRGQGAGLRVAVETFEEGILRILLENQLRFERGREAFRQAGLAHADGTFDDDVTLHGNVTVARAQRVVLR
jgi:hypothetical protein